jgi:hypothetical protein
MSENVYLFRRIFNAGTADKTDKSEPGANFGDD